MRDDGKFDALAPARPGGVLGQATPDGWPRASGYAHGVIAEGRMVFVSGQIGWDGNQDFHSDDFVDQVAQALRNTVDILAAAGAGPDSIVRMTWYVTDKRVYLDRAKEIGAVYRDIIGRSFPAMSVVEVSALLEDRARVEIESTAVMPPDAPAPVNPR